MATVGLTEARGRSLARGGDQFIIVLGEALDGGAPLCG